MAAKQYLAMENARCKRRNEIRPHECALANRWSSKRNRSLYWLATDHFILICLSETADAYTALAYMFSRDDTFGTAPPWPSMRVDAYG